MANRNIDLCTLVWPMLECGARSLQNGEARWLVGWNPRGLVVVAATFIDAKNISEANRILSERREELSHRQAGLTPRTNKSSNVAKGLRILGRIRGENGSSSSISASLDEVEASVKHIRQQADIWLELQWAPSLQVLELYCCGFKVQQFHLHIVRCDSMHETMRVAPVVMTALSRFGIDGIRALVFQNVKPLMVSGSESVYEGCLLPKHMQQILKGSQHTGLELLQAAATAVGSVGQRQVPSANTTPAPSPQKPKDDHPQIDISGIQPPKPLTLSSDGGNDSFGSDVSAVAASAISSNVSLTNSISQKPLAPSSADVELAVPKGRPPRLDFPEHTDVTELSAWLYLCNAGARLHTAFASNDKCGASSSTSPSDAATKVRANNSNNNKNVAAVPLKIFLRVLERLLPVTTCVARVSYVGRMLEYRQRECINWLSILCGESYCCGLHPLIPHVVDKSEGWSCGKSFVVRVLVDMCLGVLCSLLLVWFRTSITSAIGAFAWYGLNDLHVGYLQWFRGWPGGFKMNDDLNAAISTFNMGVLNTWSDVISRVRFDWINASYNALVCMAPLGASFGLCFFGDCCNFVTQHLRMLFHMMEIIYRLFVSLLSCLIAQFQGKKKNPLRKRVDSFDFGMDQMLFGTLLCTATLFLFPTIALYYYYFALVRTSVWVVQEILLAGAILCSNVPLFPFAYWCVYRKQMPSGVALRQCNLRCGSSTSATGSGGTRSSPPAPSPQSLTTSSVITSPASINTSSSINTGVILDLELKAVPMPLCSAIFDFTVVRWAVSRPFSLPNLLRFIVFAEAKPCVNAQTTVFPHLCRDPSRPTII